MTGLVALVGPNGSGKSALLHALRFFSSELQPDEQDCWGGDPTLTIEVALVLSIGENDVRLDPYRRDDGTISVARRSIATDSGRETYYVAQRKGNPDFVDVRAASAATPAREAYNTLRAEKDKYGDLPAWTSFAALPAVLEAWEAEHADDLVWVEDRSVGLESGSVQLSEFLEPVFVPAVRDAIAESQDAKASVLSILIDRIVDPKRLFKDGAEKLDADLRKGYEGLIAGTGDALEKAAATITARLERFAPGAAVDLEWEGRPSTVSTPGVRARLVEGGHIAEIGRQGHGVQRAYILALLHELVEGSGDDVEDRPFLFLMIEEPELYQHPTRARMLARVLRDLSIADDARVQVMYATHSPYFVGIDRIESLRMFRLDPAVEFPSTLVTGVALDEIAEQLWVATGGGGEPFTRETLLPRLRLLTDVPVADGFFSDGAILVEGEEDRAFLLAAAQEAGLDLDGQNVAIIPVAGKSNLDRPLLVFEQLGIPTYVVFDGDRNIAEQQRAANGRLNRLVLTLLGAEPNEAPLTQVAPGFACFSDTLAGTIREEVGENSWDQALLAAAGDAGYVKLDQARKSPSVLLETYTRIRDAGSASVTLDAVVEAIRVKFGL